MHNVHKTKRKLAPGSSAIEAVLAGATLSPPPIWLMRQAGRYLPEYRSLREKAGSFLRLCYTPELAVEATLQPVRRFDFDGAIVFADILLIADALGCALEFRENEGPVLAGVRDLRGLEAIEKKDPSQKLSSVYATVAGVREILNPGKTLIGFSGAPWTVAVYMMQEPGEAGRQRAAEAALSDPAFSQRLIDRLVDVTVEYLVGQIEAGAGAVQIFESWAGLAPESAFARLCLAPVAAITERIKKRYPGFPVIAFPKGAGRFLEGYVAATGVDCLSLDTSVDPAWAARRIQPHAAVQGNLDPRLLVHGGEAFRQRVDYLLRVLGKGPYIFNLGHGILPETPLEHVAELVGLVRSWRAMD
jgi:uroporphyrinogen decarboxylase